MYIYIYISLSLSLFLSLLQGSVPTTGTLARRAASWPDVPGCSQPGSEESPRVFRWAPGMGARLTLVGSMGPSFVCGI